MKLSFQVGGELSEVQVPAGARLLDYIQEAKLPINAACGGNGTCHKCRVRVREGFVAATARDQVAFRDSELKAGWRLSCQVRPKTNALVEIPAVENFRAKPRIVRIGQWDAAWAAGASDALRLVCDLGSTGVVVALVGPAGADPASAARIEAHLLNRQIRFGADVMTRLKQAQDLGVEPLRKSILETLSACLRALQEVEPASFARAKSAGLFCAGNSAMTSFLLNWPIETLAVAPFQPAQLRADGFDWAEWDGMAVQSLPLLAGFVGADTVAGILAVEARASRPATWALVDIGTNTEIVIWNGREYWLSSAPAGPAFEGGNISQGMRAESGAIAVARYAAAAWQLETIGGDVARGICGSGLIDLLHEGVRSGLINRDGFLPDGRLDVTPEISLLADDVREFQLAKSATRTALELLIERSGCKPEVIYLAGTFAQNLRLESVFGVGLLPHGYRTKVLGNASLAGVIRWAFMTGAERAAAEAQLESKKRPVELALQDDFQERFVRHLDFSDIAAKVGDS